LSSATEVVASSFAGSCEFDMAMATKTVSKVDEGKSGKEWEFDCLGCSNWMGRYS
jgi:hypothetical protein